MNNEELWEERYSNYTKKINDHETRISKLEFFKAATEERIDNLIKSIDTLALTLKWFIGLLIGSFVAFFFYAAQLNFLK